MVKNVNRSTDTWDLLEKLEQGKLNTISLEKRCVPTPGSVLGKHTGLKSST